MTPQTEKTTEVKTITVADVARIVTMVPYRCCRLMNRDERFAAEYELQNRLAEKAKHQSGRSFAPDNHTTWAVQLWTGEFLAMRFSDGKVYIGSQIEFGDW